MKVHILVPARLASQRFPRKLLHGIAGVPLILHTARRIAAQVPELPLTFAVDSQELEDVLATEGFASVRTDPDLPSGTDRLAAANRELGADVVINVQADEPLVTAAQIRALGELVAREGVDMATLATPFATAEEFAEPARVKVVCDLRGHALYFSRAPIPFARDADGLPPLAGPARPLLHLGLYAYRAAFLERFTKLPPSPLEQLEKLEQLRALENGCTIAVGVSEERTLGIDTPADAESFAARLAKG